MKTQLKKVLLNIDSIKFCESIDLTRFSTMRLKCIGNLIEVYSINALQETLYILNKNKLSYRVIGWGANTLLPKKLEDEVLILLKFKHYSLADFDSYSDVYKFPACLSLPYVVKLAQNFKLGGFEALTGIPASVGGACFMNAGTRLGEMSQLVQKVLFINEKGEKCEELISENSFSYRKNHFLKKGDVIYEVHMSPLSKDENVSEKIVNYRKFRQETQPLKSYNCGCIFKNPPGYSAGKLIDEAGLKGYRHKGLVISDLHANFIINEGEASLIEFKELIDIVKERVLESSGQVVECEVRYT